MSKDWKRQGHNGVKLNVSLQVTLMMARVMVSGMSVNTQPTGHERASTPDRCAPLRNHNNWNRVEVDDEGAKTNQHEPLDLK